MACCQFFQNISKQWNLYILREVSNTHFEERHWTKIHGKNPKHKLWQRGQVNPTLYEIFFLKWRKIFVICRVGKDPPSNSTQTDLCVQRPASLPLSTVRWVEGGGRRLGFSSLHPFLSASDPARCIYSSSLCIVSSVCHFRSTPDPAPCTRPSSFFPSLRPAPTLLEDCGGLFLPCNLLSQTYSVAIAWKKCFILKIETEIQKSYFNNSWTTSKKKNRHYRYWKFKDQTEKDLFLFINFKKKKNIKKNIKLLVTRISLTKRIRSISYFSILYFRTSIRITTKMFIIW